MAAGSGRNVAEALRVADTLDNVMGLKRQPAKSEESFTDKARFGGKQVGWGGH
jgi:hypothetical protein